MRRDGRNENELRPVSMQPGFIPSADGSVLIGCGNTRVICTASVEEKVPPFLEGKGSGWITAEYAMLPASTAKRKSRSIYKPDSRGIEIQRLIGRSLRAAVDLTKLGERTITLDCDVIQADGGTRTSSITGAYVALKMAIDKLLSQGLLHESPLFRQIAAVSVGVIDGVPCLDLDYSEDSRADVDMNAVMTDSGEFIELQGTGEHAAFSKKELDRLIELAQKGIAELMNAQNEALSGYIKE